VKSDDPDTPTAYVSSELSNFAFNGIHYYLFKYKQDLTNQINAKVKRDGESPDMKIASDIITFVEASELAEGIKALYRFTFFSSSYSVISK
jgi:hypothetical protein